MFHLCILVLAVSGQAREMLHSGAVAREAAYHAGNVARAAVSLPRQNEPPQMPSDWLAACTPLSTMMPWPSMSAMKGEDASVSFSVHWCGALELCTGVCIGYAHAKLHVTPSLSPL